MAAVPLAWSFGGCGAFVLYQPWVTNCAYSAYCAPHSIPMDPISRASLLPTSALKAAANEDDESAIIDVPVLFESDRILIVNKPPGIAHHNDIQEDGDAAPAPLGIVNLLRKQRNGERLWGVHRLDRVTSGILILAKDVGMAQALTECFAEGRIQKVYMGVSAKRPSKKKQGWVQGGMVRSRDKSWKLTRNDKTNFAKTRFFTAPIQHNSSHKKFTLILFRPYTGKTHQLRVAAKSVSLPLFGDPIYKDGSSSVTRSAADNSSVTRSAADNNEEEETDDSNIRAQRTYLHASGILIPALLENPEIAVFCPPPFDDVVEESTEAVAVLMHKYCDVPAILHAMA
jgi:tRNA pseudouridine32 synthase/23S rRNA pseudouridine746 synthase